MVEITLPEGSPFAGRRVGDVDWPNDTVLVVIIREERLLAPTPDDAMEAATSCSSSPRRSRRPACRISSRRAASTIARPRTTRSRPPRPGHRSGRRGDARWVRRCGSGGAVQAVRFMVRVGSIGV